MGITLLGTALSCGVSLLLNYLLLFSDTLTPFGRSLTTALAVPLVVGAPLSFLLAYSFRTIHLYRRALTRAASHDRATDTLNGSSFSSIVERRASVKSGDGPRQGAFLIVNADGVKAINIRHGLEWGEEALRLIATTIRSSVRSEDIVGRLTQSEFGIFLSGATEDNARDVGQRILAGIRQVYFAPQPASKELLDVRVAGIHFEGELDFAGMYRAAEQQLSRMSAPGEMEIAHLGAASSSADPPDGRTAF